MNKLDKKQRSSLIKQLEKKGISPLTQSVDSTEYNQIIKSILDHMNNVGGYSSDQVREDIEAIINLKSVNDRFYEVNHRNTYLIYHPFIIFYLGFTK